MLSSPRIAARGALVLLATIQVFYTLLLFNFDASYEGMSSSPAPTMALSKSSSVTTTASPSLSPSPATPALSNAAVVESNNEVYTNLTVEELFVRFQAKLHTWHRDTWPLEAQAVSMKGLQGTLTQTKRNNPNIPMYSFHAIEHIYYTNLDKNVARCAITNAWLGRLQANTGVPYKRMTGKRGVTKPCVPSKSKGDLCVGVSGLAYSLLNILDNENVTGPTLVFEDDYMWDDKDFNRLYKVMEMLPDDWDIVRFDCWNMQNKDFAAQINPYVINTTTFTPQSGCEKDDSCDMCGGTHSMMWRGRPSTLDKLRQTWSIQPFADVDYRISHNGHQFGLKSYCINVGLGSLVHIPTEDSDIPKNLDQEARLASQ